MSCGKGCRDYSAGKLPVNKVFYRTGTVMSITLEGNTSLLDEYHEWSGLWKFTKEKKSFLAFKYRVSTPTN